MLLFDGDEIFLKKKFYSDSKIFYMMKNLFVKEKTEN